jgi:hypothetical protein
VTVNYLWSVRVAQSKKSIIDLGHQPHFVACVDAAMASALPQVQELARKEVLPRGHYGKDNADTTVSCPTIPRK